MIKLHLKSNIDLRQAETVTVAFYKDDKILLTKTGEELDIKQSRVDLELSAGDIALWEPGRYIGIDVKATYTDGTEHESNYVYRSFDVTQSRTEYWANTYFGDDEPHHSDVVDTGDATLTSGSQMLAPYTAYAKGNKYTGTIQTYAGQFMPVLGSIAVVTQPTKMEYDDGEDIDLTGAVVKAYYPSGKPWEGDENHPNGVIPLTELELEPETAHTGAQRGVWTDGDGLNALKISYTTIEESDTWYCYDGKLGTYHHYDANRGWVDDDASVGGTGAAELFVTRYNNQVYASRISGNGLFYLFAKNDNGKWIFSGSTTYSPQIGEFTHGVWDEYLTGIPESTKNPTETDPSDLEPSTKQNIIIKWPRVGDGQILETAIQISVSTE